MRKMIVATAVAMVAGCAVPTTGVVPRSEGMFTITRQGEGFWVQTIQLTAMATQDAEAHCTRSSKKLKVLHTKEIPAGPMGRWPESEVLFRCE